MIKIMKWCLCVFVVLEEKKSERQGGFWRLRGNWNENHKKERELFKDIN